MKTLAVHRNQKPHVGTKTNNTLFEVYIEDCMPWIDVLIQVHINQNTVRIVQGTWRPRTKHQGKWKH